MALTDLVIRQAKPGEKPLKKADAKGLYLYITTAGGKLWRFDYRHNGRRGTLALGSWPEVSLTEARTKRDDARKLLANGNDPALVKKREKIAAKAALGNTFGAIGAEYLEREEAKGRASVTIDKQRWILNDKLGPVIGSMPISEIGPVDLLAALRKMEEAGNLETARRARSFASRVFRYAAMTGRAQSDPTALLKGAIATPQVKHFAAILDPKRVGELLRAIEGYGGQPSTRLALALAPHVFVRPGEIRAAEWSEVDFENKRWTIVTGRTKMRKEHIVPLSRQSLALLEQAHALSGSGRYVFPGQRQRKSKGPIPLSENTILGAIRRLGFGPDEMTAHGFRTTASTLLNESGKWAPDAIERALSHGIAGGGQRAIYNQGQYWDERVNMAQWWSDKLDALRAGAKIVPFLRETKTS